MRQVQKDKKNRIKLVCDVLYIEEEVYTSPFESAPQISSTRQTGPIHESQQTRRGRDRQPNKRQRKESTLWTNSDKCWIIQFEVSLFKCMLR